MLVDICQTYLDEASIALLAGDFDAYLASVCMPFILIGPHDTKIMQSAGDLRLAFDDYYRALRSQHVTQLIRLADSATLMQDNLISGTYLTHVLCNGTWVSTPHKSLMALRKVNERWKAACVTNSYYNTGLIDPPTKTRQKLLQDSFNG